MKPEHIRRIRLLVLVLVLALAVLIGQSCFCSVSESEQAVITTFGKYAKTVDAGLHTKLPWPIQEAQRLPVNMSQKI